MEQQANIFKALSEPARLRIMVLLTHGELRVNDLVAALDLPQSTVSRHLAYLKKEALVVVRTRTVESFYAINHRNDILVTSLLGCLKNCFTGDRTAQADERRLKALLRNEPQPSPQQTTSVLFVCVHNAARSQMAEAYLRHHGGSRVAVESAGTDPGGLNRMVIDLLKETGIDITGNRSKNVFDIITGGRTFDYVITVCRESEGTACPTFPGNAIRLHWEFDDPASIDGDYVQQLEHCRKIRDGIEHKVLHFLASIEVGEDAENVTQ